MGTVFGIAPIVAPTVGGLVVTAFGWRTIFVVLGLLAIFVILAVWLGLPETSGSDTSVSMRPRQIVSNYLTVFREPRFVVYAMVSGATTAGLFSYIAGSPFVFINLLGFSAAQYGWIFGGNAVALLLASVVNRMLLKRRSGTSIALFITGMQSAIGLLLLVGVLAGFLPKIIFLGLIAIYLFGFGFVAPNTASASLQPFSRNVGSASALLGSIQMISGATASALVSYLHNGTAMPMALMMAASACVSLGLAVAAASSFRSREETFHPG
jgi:DHA1 family bicyclomycin/chloramphenicol resistance-like MFS transporter